MDPIPPDPPLEAGSQPLPTPVETAEDCAPSPARHASRPGFKGSIRLGRLAGTDVFVHWSWFAAAVYLILNHPVQYSSLTWDVAEYLAAFGLVLLHEFGHVLACRQVGGSASRVLLWPLGGLAFVAPPPRPGALFWTIAAGPLVNVVLTPVLFLLQAMIDSSTLFSFPSDFYRLVTALAWFNVVILVFNLLPVFPLDGGRLLHALLWRLIGRIPGLTVAASIGMVAGGALGVFALSEKDWWLAVMAGFLVLGALGGLAQARLLTRLQAANHHTDRACPNCGTAPPIGPFWRCAKCFVAFDLLEPAEICPKGGWHTSSISCLECGRELYPDEWVVPSPAASAEPLIANAVQQELDGHTG